MIQMKFLCFAAASLLAVHANAAMEIKEQDAYARADETRQIWEIGTSAVQLTYSCREGTLNLVSLRNKTVTPNIEYVAQPLPFGTDTLGLGKYTLESIWSKSLTPGESADPAAEDLRIEVKRDDLIGFAAATRSDDGGAALHWETVLDYGDGTLCASAEDAELPQGPLWFYYAYAPGTGYLDELGEVIPAGQGKARVPTGYRAPAECSRLNGSEFRLTNGFGLIRAWKAPKDGTAIVRGAARHAEGNTAIKLNVFRITETPPQTFADAAASGAWIFESGAVHPAATGGRPAIQLDFLLNRDGLRARLCTQAYPRTALLRQWLEIENTAAGPITADLSTPFRAGLQKKEPGDLTQCWMYGGTSRPNQGLLDSAVIGESYHRALLGDRTDNYVSWSAIISQEAPADGLFIALDQLGTWVLGLDSAPGCGVLSASFPALGEYTLAAGEQCKLPMVTLGVFDGDLDDMGRRLYDWQYEYLWDYTHSDYYARTKWVTPWFFCSRNLQEQFTARLAGLDMQADLMQTMGMELLWDDAGWSKYPGWPIEDSYSVVFSPTYEGPDFAETLRYLKKMEMTWLLWMAGRPSAGLLDTKAGSWGDFQWRTDGFGRYGLRSEAAMRGQIEHFLSTNPRCSFHTCCGGSRYAHQFEMQRFADVNYLSDMGRGEETNHYFSYLELPDKWVDILDALIQPGNKYNPETGPALLSMAPGWYMRAEAPEQEQLRRLMEIYRYLRQEGVAGRWSHMMHPAVRGDKEFYYDQRTAYDGLKACIILKHRVAGEVTVFPKGLLPEHRYEIGYECDKTRIERTGQDLMTNGITLKDTAPGELIYLGLPEIPGAGNDAAAPAPPGQALFGCETNLGHSGVGIYWSPSGGSHWISYYEVRRGEEIIGKASVGTYYFDHAPGWEAAAPYAVRAVNGDGLKSEWTPAHPLPNSSIAYAALGGLFPQPGRDGWSAEITSDGNAYAPMTWVPPAKNPAGDIGGTPNQPGGVEGYWEGPGLARVGRGWQQASPEAACVRTWQAPESGNVSVIGRAMKEYYRQAQGGPLRVRILHNDTQVWPAEGWAEVPVNSLQGAAHHLNLAIAKGDTLRFILDRGASPETDIIAWMPRITYETPATPQNGSCIRILCGSEKDYTDQSGNVWAKDQYFAGGESLSAEAPIENALPTAEDTALYQHGRMGQDFTYSIPVTPGLYTLRLKLAETQYQWSFERPFSVSVNGRNMLRNFDICHAARGANRAYEQVFRNLVPDENGLLVIRFTGGMEPVQKTGKALVQAIEILPETRAVILIDAGADAEFIDWSGFVWAPYRHYPSGIAIRSEAPVSHASPTLCDQGLYQTAHSGKTIRCSIPVAPGLYAVHLKFAELWLREIGKRPMNVRVNGKVARAHWDPAQAAGQIGMAADIRVPDITPDVQGKIVIEVNAEGENDAILQGIEIE